MRPQIILHVGTEKTGTTSIQSLLRTSYNTLAKNGVLFPQSIGEPCHIHLTACALGGEPNHPIRNLLGLTNADDFKDFVEKTKTGLKNEIEINKAEVLLISDEHINVHLSKIESLGAFKTLCEEFGDIKSVVIYLRRQDEFRLSLFSEAVKAGNLTSFELDNPLPVFEKLPYRLDYLAVLDNLSEVFGIDKIVTRKYNRGSFPSDDICIDFLDATGITLGDYIPIQSVKNRTIDGRIIKLLGLISTSIKRLNKNRAEDLLKLIISNCEKIFTGPGPTLAKEAHVRFQEQFHDRNKTIKEKYFNSHQVEKGLFGNNYESVKDTYPGCTLSWPEFFIRYVIGTVSGSLKVQIFDNPVKADQLEISSEHTTQANCTICGSAYSIDITCHSREGKLCPNCGASGRTQAIGFHASIILCGSSVPLKEHLINKSKKVVGLSDGKVYADILNTKYDYTNSFYHREPFLDIANPPDRAHGIYDLLISTEVFEHIVGPSVAAFKGAFDILKPGGYMILTVPFINKGESVEHYREDLINYTSHQNRDGSWFAELEFSDGHKEIDNEAKFHGGPGKTLEIRLFNRDRLIEELNIAGFVEVDIHDENMPEKGINWGAASRVITARKPLN